MRQTELSEAPQGTRRTNWHECIAKILYYGQYVSQAGVSYAADANLRGLWDERNFATIAPAAQGDHASNQLDETAV